MGRLEIFFQQECNHPTAQVCRQFYAHQCGKHVRTLLRLKCHLALPGVLPPRATIFWSNCWWDRSRHKKRKQIWFWICTIFISGMSAYLLHILSSLATYHLCVFLSFPFNFEVTALRNILRMSSSNCCVCFVFCMRFRYCTFRIMWTQHR